MQIVMRAVWEYEHLYPRNLGFNPTNTFQQLNRSHKVDGYPTAYCQLFVGQNIDLVGGSVLLSAAACQDGGLLAIYKRIDQTSPSGQYNLTCAMLKIASEDPKCAYQQRAKDIYEKFFA